MVMEKDLPHTLPQIFKIRCTYELTSTSLHIFFPYLSYVQNLTLMEKK